MQVDAQPEENDNVEEDQYIVENTTLVRKIYVNMYNVLYMYQNASTTGNYLVAYPWKHVPIYIIYKCSWECLSLKIFNSDTLWILTKFSRDQFLIFTYSCQVSCFEFDGSIQRCIQVFPCWHSTDKSISFIRPVILAIQRCLDIFTIHPCLLWFISRILNIKPQIFPGFRAICQSVHGTCQAEPTPVHSWPLSEPEGRILTHGTQLCYDNIQHKPISTNSQKTSWGRIIVSVYACM